MRKTISPFVLIVTLTVTLAACGISPAPTQTPGTPQTEDLIPAPTPTPNRELKPEDTPPTVSLPASATPAEVQPRPTAVLVPDSDEVLALVNATLIDGTGADPLPDAALVIQAGHIIAVGSRTEIEVPVDAKTIDLQGATLLPGIINTHVHLGFDEEKLKAWAQGGVTTVRDLGAYPSTDLFSRRDTLLENDRCARLVAAGPMVTVPDGYPMVPWGFQGLVITSPEDASEKTNQLLDDGADVIKISLESGYIFREKIPMLSTEEAAAIAQAAHERGTLVSAHVTASQDLWRALDARVDDIAHMVTNTLPDQLIERLVENDVYWVPTLELWNNVGYGEERAIANLRKFVEAGGKVALGTDYAGYNARFDLGMPITEIELMQEAGMTPMQIIIAGTQNAAHVCDLDHELGTLEVGKIADVLIVDGDPLEDIHALTNTRMVIHNGVVIRDEGNAS